MPEWQDDGYALLQQCSNEITLPQINAFLSQSDEAQQIIESGNLGRVQELISIIGVWFCMGAQQTVPKWQLSLVELVARSPEFDPETERLVYRENEFKQFVTFLREQSSKPMPEVPVQSLLHSLGKLRAPVDGETATNLVKRCFV